MENKEVAAIPLPIVTDEDRPYWQGVQEGKLLLQKCLDCGRVQFYPRPVCVNCFSMNLGWQQAKGTGTIYSFTPIRAPQNPAARKIAEETGILPIFASIDLDEGIRMIGEIVGSRPGELKIGARVHVGFEEATGTNFKLPKFRLIK